MQPFEKKIELQRGDSYLISCLVKLINEIMVDRGDMKSIQSNMQVYLQLCFCAGLHSLWVR
jgi:hypothetical protein